MITTYAVSLDAVDCSESDRIALVDTVDEWLMATFPVDSRGPGMTVRSRADVVYRVTITDAPPSGQHVETISVTVFMVDGHLWFDLRSYTSPSGSRVIPLRTSGQPPKRLVRLVTAVLARMRATDANHPISTQPTVIATDVGADGLVALLDAPGRRLPAVIEFVEDRPTRKPLTSSVSTDLAGLAHIFQVTTRSARARVSSVAGPSLINDGTVMVVWPGRHEPVLLRARELPPASLRPEWERLVALVAESAARSLAAPRVPPPPRDEWEPEDDEDDEPTDGDDTASEGEPEETDEDVAAYIEYLESQVNTLEASRADADRIIAEQQAALQMKGDQLDELVLRAVNLEIHATKGGNVVGVRNMREAMRLAVDKYCPFLVFHERAIATGNELQGPDPESVLRDLVRLNNVAREWQSGGIVGDSFHLLCRRMGLDFVQSVSENAEQKFASDYMIDWHGRQVIAGAHIRRGRGAHLVRIHMYIDHERQQVVVAYIGRHLRDKSSR
jgi:hypothetical protein